MERSIVCGVDGSDESRGALRVAAQLSRQLGRRLVVAHVWQAPMPVPVAGYPAARALSIPSAYDTTRAAEGLLETLASEEGIEDADLRPLSGFPAVRLADLGDEENADLIVVGSRGRGSFKSAILGSVSHDVIAFARRPVLVVPPAV